MLKTEWRGAAFWTVTASFCDVLAILCPNVNVTAGGGI